jgi:hypothetical protein
MDWLKDLAEVVKELPLQWQMALASLVLSLFLTQWIKSFFMAATGRELTLLAFATGFIPPALAVSTPFGVLAGLVSGFASPTIYKVVVMAIRWRAPALAIALSADSPSYKLSDWLSGSSPSSDQVGSYLQRPG